ncbi:zinc finger protein 208-like [Belonocnema kinseyi]|uniref:zinc finger protein 208-like n=1 Tax=Belonocnema kinseyi TaxID=2817044 RepID=UPI00143DC144|nr:zinc finger protein 208-like [Belonocnema kinseyi]
MEYDIDKTVEIKKEITEDPETITGQQSTSDTAGNSKSDLKKSTEGQDSGLFAFQTIYISSANKPAAETLIKYEIDETLEIKDAIIQDREKPTLRKRKIKRKKIHCLNPDRKYKCEECERSYVQKQKKTKSASKETRIKSTGEYRTYPSIFRWEDHNLLPRSLEEDLNPGIEFISVETLKINEKIIEEKSKSESEKSYPLANQWEHHNELLINTKKDITCRIEYSNDEALDIKEGIIETNGNYSKKEVKLSDNRKYHPKLFEVHQAKRNPTNEDSNKKSERKHKCEKCARTYKQRRLLNQHQRFECDGIPKFGCYICGKRFARQPTVWRHIEQVHKKINLNKSKERFNCDKCSLSYASQSGLNRHKYVKHEEFTRQYICHECDYKTTEKGNLCKHIARHLK